MAITAKDVQKLREMTGVGMMDCKKALTEAEGDFDKATRTTPRWRRRGSRLAAPAASARPVRFAQRCGGGGG